MTTPNSTSPNKVIIVQGGQYGSEAKGAIAHFICQSEDVGIAVRTGATNAGHTVMFGHDAIKFQQLPVAALLPRVQLVLGAGSLIDPEILERECRTVDQLTGGNVRSRLFIDPRAGIHLPAHQLRSQTSGRHYAIGATGKGSSEALMDKIRGRGQGYRTFGYSEYRHKYQVVDTELFLNEEYDAGQKILLEGTQGQGLDLNLGPYPFTTHKPCGPAQWLVECGLSPALPLDIVMVIRTFPIRVAGNSGPMHAEISWPQLAREINSKLAEAGKVQWIPEDMLKFFEEALVRAGNARGLKPFMALGQQAWTPAQREQHALALSEMNKEALNSLHPDVVKSLQKLFEMTTVTKKLRRIAELDYVDLAKWGRQIRPHRTALTFMNYKFPEFWGRKPEQLNARMQHYVEGIERAIKSPVTITSFGPRAEDVMVIPPIIRGHTPVA